MSASADAIRDQQRIIWDGFSAGWRKWDAELMAWHTPFGDALLEEAELRPDSAVLDVAAGSGEPGLTAAARVPDGSGALCRHFGGDAPGGAGEGGGPPGWATCASSSATRPRCPFDDGAFDAVFCRFGFMFFPDMSAALREMVADGEAGGTDQRRRLGPRRGKPVGQPGPRHDRPAHGTAGAAGGDARAVPLRRPGVHDPDVQGRRTGRRDGAEGQHRPGARIAGELLGVHDRHRHHRVDGAGEGGHGSRRHSSARTCSRCWAAMSTTAPSGCGRRPRLSPGPGRRCPAPGASRRPALRPVLPGPRRPR